jgi:dTDP-glucose 4,6-dehydratase
LSNDAIAIIGVNSFSGSWMARFLLERGVNVLGFARTMNRASELLAYTDSVKSPNSLEIVQANLVTDHDRIADAIIDSKVTCVINYASQSMVAESWNNPEDWYDTNLVALSKMTKRFISGSRNYLQKFIQFSTPEVYGSTNGLVKENWSLNPTTPYAVSRAASDLHLKAMHSAYGFPVIFTRAANVYGRHQPLYRLIPKLIMKALKNEVFLLHGTGESKRSFIHIEDTCQAVWNLVTGGRIGDSYHISSQEFVSIREVAIQTLRTMGKDENALLVNSPERLGKDLEYCLDSNKIRLETDWSDKISLQEGIADTVSWIEREIRNLENLPLEYRHTR